MKWRGSTRSAVGASGRLHLGGLDKRLVFVFVSCLSSASNCANRLPSVSLCVCACLCVCDKYEWAFVQVKCMSPTPF